LASPSRSIDSEQACIAYLAELLGLGQDRAPVLAAALGLQPPHRGGAVGSCLGRQAVVLGEVAGPKRVQRPVLQQDVDLPPQRRRTRCEQRGGVELLVGSRQQRDRQGLLAVAHVPASSL